jgi:hypothetical protein
VPCARDASFNVRVAIVEPGVVATPIFTKGPPPRPSLYPHGRRLGAIFAAALAKPTPPSVIGDLIRDIVNGDSWQLRYLAGPDAAPRVKARMNKTDEQVILEAAASDEEFVARIKRETGVDLVL